MPELPEVETIRRQLAEKIIGKKLLDREIVGVRRRAKLLIIDFKNGDSLIFHLKLTGQLILNGEPSRYTRKVFNFKDGSCLVFNDLRKFGWHKIVKKSELIEKNFGPEPLEMDFKTFEDILSKKPKIRIKVLLMDQKMIAGIGNIYSDEVLFSSGVRPTRLTKSLKEPEKKKIFQNIKKILRKAIKYGGSSVEHYLDACGKKGNYVRYHKAYQHKTCSVCKGNMVKMKIVGRSAHFCPICQK